MSTTLSRELAELPPPDLGELVMPTACPICNSPFVGYLRHTPTRRTKRMVPLFGCYRCRSLFNPNGYVEDEVQLRKDLDWHISVTERNRAASA